MPNWLGIITPYLLLSLTFLYLVYLAGRKDCSDCPHTEKWLCFEVCEEFKKGLK